MDGASSLCKVVVFAGLGLGITIATAGAAAAPTAAYGAMLTAGGGLAGGFFGNLVSGACQDWVKRKRKSSDWTHNHHLQLLVIRAISAVIRKTAEEEEPVSKKLINLAEKVHRLDSLPLSQPGFLRLAWWRVTGRGELHLPDLKDMEAAFQGAGEGFRGLESLSPSEWNAALSTLDLYLDGAYSSLVDSRKDLICRRLEERFSSNFLDVAAHPDIKSQAAHRKLISLMQTEILKSVREMMTKIDAKDVPPGGIPTKEEGANDLYFSRCEIPVVGRERELSQLTGFLWSEKTFRWMSLSGEMGLGKSRLALALSQDAAELGWKVIWYSPKAGAAIDGPGYTAWSNWIPNQPTLLVIDDALDYPNQTASCLKNLSDRGFNHKPQEEHPIRVLLLTREPHQAKRSTGQAQAPSLWDKVWEGLTVPQHTKVQNLASKQLVLTPIASKKDQDSLLLKAGIKNQDLARLKEALGDLKGNPLMALAAAFTDSGESEGLTLSTIAHELLNRELQRWQESGFNEGHVSLAFFATLMEGLDWHSAVLPSSLEPSRTLSAAQRTALTGGTSERLNPVLPHFLGSALLLSRLVGTCALEGIDKRRVSAESWELVDWAKEQRAELGPLKRLLVTFPSECWDEGITGSVRLLAVLTEQETSAGILRLISSGNDSAASSWLREELVGKEGEVLLSWMELVSQNERLWIVGRLKKLYEEDSLNPGIQVQHAMGLYNLTLGADLAECRTIVEGPLRDLYNSHPENTRVQEYFAAGLNNLTVGADLAECRTTVEGPLRDLYNSHPENTRVQEYFAAGLNNLTVAADLAERRTTVEGPLRDLYNSHPENKGVQEYYATGLYNLTLGADLAERRTIVEGPLRDLYLSHPENIGVQERYASGLVNLTAVADLAEGRTTVEGPLRDLYNSHPENTRVQEYFAAGLNNLTVAADLAECRTTVEGPLRELYNSHPENKGVQERYARGLANLTAEADLAERRTTVGGPLRDLYLSHPENIGVQERYARGLNNLTVAADLAECRTTVEGPLRDLYNSHPENKGVQEHYARGLANLTAEADLAECRTTVEGPLRDLYLSHPENIGVQERYAGGLFNLTAVADLAEAAAAIGRLCSVPKWGDQVRSAMPRLCERLLRAHGFAAEPMVEQIMGRMKLPDGELPQPSEEDTPEPSPKTHHGHASYGPIADRS